MNFIFLSTSFLLLILSRRLFINLLTKISFLLTGKINFAKKLYFFLFFPGIILHELSHFFTASLLFVPTGKINLFPKEEKMASVQIAKTDPIRSALIGLSPTIIGTAAILAIFSFGLSLPSKILDFSQLFLLFKNSRNLPSFYLIFAINNTMFTSKEDRRPIFGFFAFLTFIATLLYLFNLFSATFQLLLTYGSATASLITTAYLFTFFINLIFISPLFILAFYFCKIVRK